jgi:type II secretory pathway predicted ATPase ExeA
MRDGEDSLLAPAESIEADEPQSNVLAVLGLREPPFAENVSDIFFFPSQQHLRALGFIGQLVWSRSNLAVITGERGIGKSLLVRHLLADLDDRVLVANVNGEHADAANPAQDFLLAVLRQFGMELEASDRNDRRRLLTRFLAHQYGLNRLCVLVVQGAHALKPAVLDELLQIAEFTVEGQRVVKLLLIGANSLHHIIDSPRMASLTDGRAPRFTVDNLSEDQVAAYVMHRLRAAGAIDPDSLVPTSLISSIHRYTAGIPRNINQLCWEAMSDAVSAGDVRVTECALREAAETLRMIPRAEHIAAAHRVQDLKADMLTGATESRAAMERALLLVSAQGAADSVVPMLSNRILVGRGDLADVRIESAFVSRYHALIVREFVGEPQCRDLLIDLGSTNGILVNSKRVIRRVLKHRDLIQVGPARITYLNPSVAAPSQIDPSETLAFARPASMAGSAAEVEAKDALDSAILAFGRYNEAG